MRRFSAVSVVGLACLLIGVVLPWAKVTAVAGSGHVSGWGHGAETASVLAIACAVAFGLRYAGIALLSALAGLGWMLMVVSDLPGTLLMQGGGAYMAEIGIGCWLMLTGFLILAACSTARVTVARPLDSKALTGSDV